MYHFYIVARRNEKRQSSDIKVKNDYINMNQINIKKSIDKT